MVPTVLEVLLVQENQKATKMQGLHHHHQEDFFEDYHP